MNEEIKTVDLLLTFFFFFWSLTLSKTSQNLKIQMKDFEVSAEPVQDWLSKTEKMVHESSNRLYDLPAKRREQQKLQVTSPWPV